MKVAIYRKERFNSAHRLFNPDWSDQQNDEIFGKCNNPNYHGHNYTLIVKLIGEVDAKTGYVYDMKKLSDIIKENIIRKFDHKNLNLDTEEFSNLNPTAENIAVISYNILREVIESQYEISLRLYETEKNFVEYPTN